MKRWIMLCAILALVQTGLTVATHLGGSSGQSKLTQGPLLPQQNATINGVLLENDKGQQLRLNKAGDRWVLPASDNFPADTTRIEALLDKLRAAQRGWPEATTSEAATRFKVAENNFAHKVTLLQDDKPGTTLYFGTAPALRKLYLRADKDAEIHSLAMTPQDLEPLAKDWLDSRILHLRADAIVRVRLPEITLERTKDGLQPVGLQNTEEPIKERVDALVKQLTQLTISNILGKEAQPQYGLDKPILQYDIELNDGTTIVYSFGKLPPTAQVEGQGNEQQPPSPVIENTMVLKVSNQAMYLQVDGWQFDALKKANRASLIKAKEHEPSASVERPSSHPTSSDTLFSPLSQPPQ